MRKFRSYPSQDELNEMFQYHDDVERVVNGFNMRGALSRRNGITAGRLIFGSLRNKDSRAQVGIDRVLYYLARLVWIMHHGDPGALLVDHEDTDPAHNRIGNFRLLTDVQNQMNRKRSRAGAKCPYIGVSVAGTGFNAFSSAEGKPIYLGRFSDAISAARARDEAAIAKFGLGNVRLNRDLFPELQD